MTRSHKALAALLASTMALGCMVPQVAAGGPRVEYQNDHGIVNYHQYVTPNPNHRSYYGGGHYRGHSSYAPRSYAYDGYDDYERDRRRKRRNDIAKGVAIGVGLAILGAALSHGGRRHR